MTGSLESTLRSATSAWTVMSTLALPGVAVSSSELALAVLPTARAAAVLAATW